MELVAINIDHYFFDLEMHPKDEFGDYDYETPQALDLALINQHLVQLLDGKTIRTPHYDFKTGKRTLDVHELQLGEEPDPADRQPARPVRRHDQQHRRRRRSSGSTSKRSASSATRTARSCAGRTTGSCAA